MDVTQFSKELAATSDEFLRMHSVFAQKVLELLPGQMGVVANGQVTIFNIIRDF